MVVGWEGFERDVCTTFSLEKGPGNCTIVGWQGVALNAGLR